MNMTHEERVRRLSGMLSQLGGEAGLEAIPTPELPVLLESTGPGNEGLADMSPPQVFVASSALDKLKDNRPISPDEAGALEAIVLPLIRPVVFIRDGMYGNISMPEWSHLNHPDYQARLNASLASIGRIELPATPSIPYGGTGFVVGPGLLMTNRHVARLFTEGLGTRLTYRPGGSAVDFKREIDSPSFGAALLEVTGVAMIHPYWDMALLRVAGLPPTARPLQLSVTSPDDLVDHDIAVVGYPAQDYRNDMEVQNRVFEGKFGVKRFAPGKVRKRESIQSFENVVSAMTHDSSTLGGCSGSAVIDVNTGKVVGLHFAGEYLKANYCVPTYELARDPRVVAAGLNFDGSVAATTDWLPAWNRAEGRSERTLNSPTATPPVSVAPGAGQVRTDPVAAPGPRSEPALAGVPASSATLNFWLPLQISITLGAPSASAVSGPSTSPGGAPVPAGAPVVTQAEVEKVPLIYPNMSAREGYRPDFLGLANGDVVPLPTLTVAGKTVAARLDDGAYELKYHRFSVILHKQRRLALFTAANADWRDISRKINGRKPTRKELDGFTGNEREDWTVDPRIPLDNQLPDYFYTKDGGTFDKGHLVRRDDVAWGDTFEEMQKGNGDTFHTTNCSPQTAEFNRPAEQNWGALEQMVERETKAEKVCIFSGPVLDANDGYFHGLIKSGVEVSIQIPRKFWKIIVANVGGQPAAFGFVLDQDLSGVDLHTELAIPNAWKAHLRPISEIETYLNGLALLTAIQPWDQFGKI